MVQISQRLEFWFKPSVSIFRCQTGLSTKFAEFKSRLFSIMTDGMTLFTDRCTYLMLTSVFETKRKQPANSISFAKLGLVLYEDLVNNKFHV